MSSLFRSVRLVLMSSLVLVGFGVASLLLNRHTTLLSQHFSPELSLAAPRVSAAAPIGKESPETIREQLLAAQLPIAGVVTRTTLNAKGTVIYVPQNHLNPGSNPSDPSNDSAVVTQNQIADITDYLTKTENVPYVMVEGSLYGNVSTSTLQATQEELAAAEELTASAKNLQCSSPACERVLEGASALARKLSRDAILRGGANAVKATGGNFALIGGEDASTYMQSGNIVRQYFYLNDRLSKLQPQQPSAQSNSTSPQLAGLEQLMARMNPPVTDVSANDLAVLSGSASAAELSALSKAVSDAHHAQIASVAVLSKAAEGLPSRSDNPYASETNPAQLKQQISSVENEMQNTIVDERNQEAAANFAKGLDAQHTSVGELVFGAGHTSGLLQALSAQGLNVVIVVPQNLGSDQELSQALAS